jgi:hypothetical protein
MSEEQERIEVVAERIKLLFGFCGELLKDRDLVERALDLAQSRASLALSAAPILGAVGLDYEERHTEAQINAFRAATLLNLLNVLEETEKRRRESKEKADLRAAGKAQIMKGTRTMTARIDFQHGAWDCWRNMFGEWGAILSRKGEKPIIITGCATKVELIAIIDVSSAREGAVLRLRKAVPLMRSQHMIGKCLAEGRL